ncbi:MAG: hypothetical protein E7585_06900 [Ruminococcaceae bacterium]|nr:hypothetical protein [Oscillospiraceae bacterium]
MKVWKMTGCLLLLCVIICGCVVMGKNTQVAAAEQEERPDGGQQEVLPENKGEVTSPVGDSSTETGKTYSEGLYFRSNGDGTCALAGMGDCTAACVLIPPQSPGGDKVIEILPYAFAGSIVGSVEIPTTVQILSAASFADCQRLAYVRVAAGSEYLVEFDGVLYTADGGTLLYCPTGRNSRELALHASLKRIAAGAFATCKALDTVCFTGTTAEWHNIVVGDENNALYAARLVFVTP